MNDINQIFDILADLCTLAIINDRYNSKLKQIKSVQKRNCGNCNHWMKSSCYPEKDFGQFKSANSYACIGFVLAHSSKYLIKHFELELEEIKTALKKVR